MHSHSQLTFVRRHTANNNYNTRINYLVAVTIFILDSIWKFIILFEKLSSKRWASVAYRMKGYIRKRVGNRRGIWSWRTKKEKPGCHPSKAINGPFTVFGPLGNKMKMPKCRILDYLTSEVQLTKKIPHFFPWKLLSNAATPFIVAYFSLENFSISN